MRMTVYRIVKIAFLWIVSPRATRLWFKVKSPPPRMDQQTARSILVLRLDEIGDAVLNSAFLRELRRSHPQAAITLVVKPEVLNLVELCPYVDEVIIFDWRAHPVLAPFVRHLRAFKLAKEKLWHKNLDLAIIPRLDTDFYHATFLAYFSKAKRRVAFSEAVNAIKSIKNRDYDLLLTDAVRQVPSSHEIEINLSILSYLGLPTGSRKLEMWHAEDDRAFARGCLPNADADFIVLAPGAANSTKQWPVERYLALSQWCVAQLDAVMVVVGGPGETDLGGYLRAGLSPGTCIDLTGKTTLRQTAAVIERCRLFIGNDTGAKHMAAALGVSVVEISRFPQGGSAMHPQSPDRFRAWGCRSIVLQPRRPADQCYDACFADRPHCILGVDLESVRQAVLEMLETEMHE